MYASYKRKSTYNGFPKLFNYLLVKNSISEENQDNYYCDELPSLKLGNTTMWGCQAANAGSDCTKNGTWWNRCCTWKEETCVEIDKG